MRKRRKRYLMKCYRKRRKTFYDMVNVHVCNIGISSPLESCDEDDEEVSEGVVVDLADEPGTTNGTQFDVLQSILLPLCEMWF